MARSAVQEAGDFEAMIRQLQRRIEILERRPIASPEAAADPGGLFPFARVYDSDGQTILNVRNTGIAFNVDIFNYYGMHAPNAGDLVAPTSGWYSCSYVGIVPPAAGGVMVYWMDVDGIAGDRWASEQVAFNASHAQHLSGCEEIYMVAGQRLMLGCYQNSGGPVAAPAGGLLQAVLRRASAAR